MAPTKFWVVLKNGKAKQFTTRKEAMAWEKTQPDHPKGRYHIYDNDPDGFAKPRKHGETSRRWGDRK